MKKCYEVMDNIHVVKETTQTVEKKPLVPMFPYLDSISFQTRIKLKKSLKTSSTTTKLLVVFKYKTILGITFHSKDHISEDLTSGVVYNFQCVPFNECYYGECERHLNIRIIERINIYLYIFIYINKC